jgi:hypothetical protein
MIGDHHGQSARRATVLVRAVGAILGTRKIKEEGHATNSRISMRPAAFGAGLLETKARIASGVAGGRGT